MIGFLPGSVANLTCIVDDDILFDSLFPFRIRAACLLFFAEIDVVPVISRFDLKIDQVFRMKLKYEIGCELGTWEAVESVSFSFSVELLDAIRGGDVEVSVQCVDVGVMCTQKCPL